MSQRRRGPGVPRADEVPFGIRALERGVEVEGVWVSRENIPEPSIHKGSTGSSIWDFMPKKVAEGDLEKQEPQQEQEHIERLRNSHAGSDSNISTAQPKTSRSSCAIPNRNRLSDPTNGTTKQKLPASERNKSRHPPPSFARYTGNHSLYRQTASVQTFEGIEAVYRASTYPNLQASHGGSSSESYSQSSSGESSSDSGPITSAAPKLLNQSRQVRPRHRSVDFELLNSHRVSQAAETGQLTPRTRKPTHSMDYTGYASDAVTSSDPEDSGYLGARPASKATSTPSSPRHKPSPPEVAALPAAVRRSSIPVVTPFAQFVQTAPSLPRPASLPSLEEVQKKRANGDSPTMSAANSPNTASKPTPPAESPAKAISDHTAAGAIRPSFEKERRFSQVVRGHGTGFEILKPGSLKPVLPPVSPPPEKQHYSLPPISLQKYRTRSRSSSVGSTGRKLQKKRRPSIESQASVECKRGRRKSAVER